MQPFVKKSTINRNGLGEGVEGKVEEGMGGEEGRETTVRM